MLAVHVFRYSENDGSTPSFFGSGDYRNANARMLFGSNDGQGLAVAEVLELRAIRSWHLRWLG